MESELSNPELLLVALLLLAFYLWPKTFPALRKRREYLSFHLASVLSIDTREAYSLLNAAQYVLIGIAISLGVTLCFGVDIPWKPLLDPLQLLYLGLMGTFAALSLSWLYVDGVRLLVNGDVGSSIVRVNWISSALNLSARKMVVALVLAAFTEELLFRGVILRVLLRTFQDSFAVALVSILFVYQQRAFLREKLQIAVVCGSSAILSVVNSYVTLASNTLLIPIIIHSSFIVFFVGMSFNKTDSANAYS